MTVVSECVVLENILNFQWVDVHRSRCSPSKGLASNFSFSYSFSYELLIMTPQFHASEAV